MKENVVQVLIAAICGAFAAYFNVLVVPIVVMLVVMCVDYITGLAGAYITKQLNSRIGIIGIIKKIAYLGLVAVGMVTDYIIYSALAQLGVSIELGYCVGMVIVIWLIINVTMSPAFGIVELSLYSLSYHLPQLLYSLAKHPAPSVFI